MSKFILFKNIGEMPDIAISNTSMGWNKTGSWRSTTPRYGNLKSPCNHNCPAGEDIQGYIDLLKKGDSRAAFELLTESNPLPAVCGRVCYHPCQANCNRASFDSEIDVRLLERYIGDWGIENFTEPGKITYSGKKVAVIGAGPAGLSAAYYLNKKGVAVTLFDSNSNPGGILYYGIPSYRLDNDRLSRELKRVLYGIELKSNMKFGSDFDIAELGKFDAVFLATGAHASKKMNIDGENSEFVEAGLDFLKKVNSGEKIELKGKSVVVVGGGNTACDVARSASRLGAKVYLVYRRTETEMPAFAEEIKELKSEPIKLEFLAAPQRIENSDKGAIVEFIRMELGEPDESGRRRPVPVGGSEFILQADKVFTAIGEDPDLSFFNDVSIMNNGEVDFSNIDKAISDKLFIGGDILPNPRTVPHAVGSGRLAAEKIEAFLSGRIYMQPEEIAVVAGVDDVNMKYFEKVNIIKRNISTSYSKGFTTKEQAVEEAGRCFSCGVCNKCDNCYNYCPDMAVIKSLNGYQVNLDFCKGCGICANECPCGSLKMDGGK